MGGSGRFVVEHLLRPEELGNHGRLFARGTLAPGHSVGYHVHEGDMELCWFLSGRGEVVEADGCPVPVGPGDCNFVPAGSGHAIRNTGTEDLVYLAVVLYQP